MIPILRKNLLFSPSCCSSSLSQARTLLLVRLQVCEFSSSSSSSSSSFPSQPHWRRLDEESRNVRVSVWWDFENCNVPNGVNVSKVAPSITEAVRANGIKGPIHITAFGDVVQLSRVNQEALAFTGIHLTHIPGGKNSADRSLLVDLMYWVSQNPPPAHLFLISGDRDFAGILHRLRMNNYNILLASPGRAADVLCSAATITWQWSSMLKGEDLTGKHFNHPPDGPFGSWYGNSKVPLENPFSAADQSTSSQNVEIHEPSPDMKLGAVPKSVARRVRQILSSRSNGMSIGDLRAELTKCDKALAKSLHYGHKSFSKFLLSIPHVQLHSLGEGNFFVRLIPSDEPCECSTAPSTTFAVKKEERGYTTTPKLNSEGKNMDRDAGGIPLISSLHASSVDDDSKSFQSIPSHGKPIEEYVDGKSSFPSFEERYVRQPPNELQKSSLGNEKVVDVTNAQLSEIQLPPKDNEVSKNETRSFKVKSKKSFDDDIVSSEDVSPKILETYTISRNPSTGIDYTMMENKDIANCKSGKFKAKNKHEYPTKKEVDEVCRSPYSSPANDSLVEKRPDGSAETYNKSSTFFSWIRSWWPFWKSSGKSDDLTAHQNKVVSNFEDSKLSELHQTAGHFEEPKSSESHQDVSHSGKPELFEDAKLAKLGQTASNFEEPKSSELHQDVSHSGKPELFEDSKLSELDKTANHFEEPKSSEPQQDVSHSGKPELFSSGSFWNDVESFVFTPKGSRLVSQSKSREDLTHKLQKHGPVVLMYLTENDILQLVELLIAEKKWLEESPSQAFPFRLTRSVQKSSLMGQSFGANGLRSLFLNNTSQSNLQKSVEHDVEKHCQSIHQTRVSKPATETKYTERSRSDILVDCQKLVSEILREHPGGYNMASFRQLFANRYGYHLDVKKLGYQKLASLLQIMPGVKLESTYIYPSVPVVCASDSETCILKTEVTNAHFDSDNELSDSAPKEDNLESTWEELGPVSANNPSQNDLESKLSQKAVELDSPKQPDYEPIVSDYDSSESDGDSSCLTQPEDQGKPKCNEQDSSFWEALDLWQISQEGENSVKKSNNVGDSCNSLLGILNSSTDSTRGTLSKTTLGNHREKQRSQKNYSFVVDPALPDKDKFIGGILDGLKKADESDAKLRSSWCKQDMGPPRIQM